MSQFSHYRWKHARTCFYTVAPQERFMVEPIGNSWLMTGFSGHGFKFGAVMGLAIAEAIAGYRTPAALSQRASGVVKSDQLPLALHYSLPNDQLLTTS